MILALVLCVTPRIIYNYVQTQFLPSDLDIIREAQNAKTDTDFVKGDMEKQDPDMTFFEHDDSLQEPTPALQKPVSLSHLRPSTFFNTQRPFPIANKASIVMNKAYLHKHPKQLIMLDLGTDLPSPVGGFAFSHSPGLRDRLLSSIKRQ